MARRATVVLLSLLALILLGTIAVLSTISFYLAIDPAAYISEQELVSAPHNSYHNNASHASLHNEKIPRIIHQTWKTDTLPDRWRVVSQGCKDLMPD